MYCSLVEGSVPEVEMLVKFGIGPESPGSASTVSWGSYLGSADRAQNIRDRERLAEILLALGKTHASSTYLILLSIQVYIFKSILLKI